ncbi:MAG: hypothetical protein Q8P76_04090 [bacterium]|nr:hypothetical protein [bacterium]
MNIRNYKFLILFLIGLWGAGNLAFAQITPDPGEHAVRVYKSGTGSGLVTDQYSQIDCGNDCQGNYIGAASTWVTLEPFPSPNSSFAGWYGCDSVNTMVILPDLPTCSVNTSPFVPRSVNAIFNSNTPWHQAKLTVTTSGDGGGSVFSNPGFISCGAVCSDNFSNPSYPLFTATLINTGSLGSFTNQQVIHIVDSSGRITVGGNRLQTLNSEGVTNPQQTIIDIADGFINVSPTIKYIYALGYRGSGNIAEYLLDVINPSAPQGAQASAPEVVNRIPLPIDSTGGEDYSVYSKIALAGNFVYITRWSGTSVSAGGSGGALLIFDISDPLNPAQVGFIAPRFSPGYGIAAINNPFIGNYAYMGQQHQFSVIDVSSPASPAVVGTVGGTGLFKGVFNEVAEAFPYVYVSSVNASDNSNTLYIIDVSKPNSPALISATPIDYFNGDLRPAVGGKLLFIGSTVYDVSDPFHPRKIGQGPGGVQYGGDTSFQVGSLNEGNDYVVTGTNATGFGIYSIKRTFVTGTGWVPTYDLLSFAPGLGIYPNPTVSLSGEPEDDSILGAWSGDVPGTCANNASCLVTAVLGAETNADARFDAAAALAPTSATLTVTKSGNGSGHVSDSALDSSSLGGASLGGGSLGFVSGGIDCGGDCDETYPTDTSVILLATPSAGSDFVKWNGCVIGAVMKDDGALWNPATLAAKQSNGANAWDGRNYSALAFQNKLWVLGGGSTLGQVWYSADNGITWAQYTRAFIAPSSWAPWWSTKFGFSALSYGTKMWVLGGTEGGSSYTNEVWSSFDGQNWSQGLNADWSPRVNFAATRFNGSMWVLGGNAKENNSFVNKNDVWSSVGSSGYWSPVNVSAAWSARQGHAAVAFNGQLWVLGGLDAGGYKNDVWSSSNGTDWIQKNSSAPWPARAFHKVLVFDNKLWVMGGSGSFQPADFKNDVWYSVDGVNWIQSGLADWPARFDFGATVFNNKMWILGGTVGSNLYVNDVWYSAAH